MAFMKLTESLRNVTVPQSRQTTPQSKVTAPQKHTIMAWSKKKHALGLGDNVLEKSENALSQREYSLTHGDKAQNQRPYQDHEQK